MIEPSCETDGYTLHTCSVCGDSYTTDTVSATGHTWTPTTIDAATCTEDGKQHFECSSCGETKAETIPALGHDYSSEVIEPSCETDGYTLHDCSRCDEAYTDTVTAATGHAWDDGEIDEDDGVIRYTCTVCGETKAESYTPEHTHDYDTLISSTPGTNCQDGGTEVWECACGATMTYSGSTTGEHSWDSGEIDEDDGVIRYTCTVCGETKTESYTPEHTHDYVKTVTAPTCTTQGYTHYKCSCGYSYYDDWVDILGHQYEAIVIAPTCEDSGYTLYVCTVCEHSYRDNVTQPLGHDKKASTTAPTCTTEGYTTETCDRCGEWWVVDRVPALGHNLINGVCTRCQYNSTCTHTYQETVYPPTCEDYGYTLYVCTKCGDSIEGDFKNSLGHSLIETGRISAQCEKDGYIEWTCSRTDCGHIEYETLPMLGHKWEALGAIVDENKTSVVTYECRTCKQHKTETVMTAAAQAQNWLLTSIRGASEGLINMYETLANGIEVGGVTAGDVITSSLIVACLLLLILLFFKVVR